MEKLCLLGVNCSNNSNNNNLFDDASKTANCKSTRMVREGCDSTELSVVLFRVHTLKEAVPPPPSSRLGGGGVGLKKPKEKTLHVH